MPTMVTMNRAAELTGVPYSAIRRWIKSGEFSYYVMVDFLNAPATVIPGSGIRRVDL